MGAAHVGLGQVLSFGAPSVSSFISIFSSNGFFVGFRAFALFNSLKYFADDGALRPTLAGSPTAHQPHTTALFWGNYEAFDSHSELLSLSPFVVLFLSTQREAKHLCAFPWFAALCWWPPHAPSATKLRFGCCAFRPQLAAFGYLIHCAHLRDVGTGIAPTLIVVIESC